METTNSRQAMVANATLQSRTDTNNIQLEEQYILM